MAFRLGRHAHVGSEGLAVLESKPVILRVRHPAAHRHISRVVLAPFRGHLGGRRVEQILQADCGRGSRPHATDDKDAGGKQLRMRRKLNCPDRLFLSQNQLAFGKPILPKIPGLELEVIPDGAADAHHGRAPAMVQVAVLSSWDLFAIGPGSFSGLIDIHSNTFLGQV